jgi:phage repressor protein C with HTH and peptisase S24 domain
MSDHDQERERLLDEIAAGRHDDALVRLVAAALAAEPASPAWDDRQFVEWWSSRARSRAARAAALLTDEDYLAAGRALQARVVARQHGIRWHREHPELLPAATGRGATPLVDLAVAAGVGRELWDEPAEAWLALAPSLGVEPPPGRYLALRIAGDSMEPVMHTGDTVLVALGRPLRSGAVVVARRPDDGYVCKRVGRLTARVAELESLAPGREVIRIPRDDQLVVGQVVAVWCHHCGSG